MKKTIVLILMVCLAQIIYKCSQSEPAAIKEATTIELKDNWYYINGEKFFIKL